MGLFNNVGRYSDVHEYIKNFTQQTQSGLKLDVNNNYDIEGKRLANVGQGVDDDDAVVMHQMESLNTDFETKLTQLKADSLQIDGSSHMTGDLDLRGQKLINPGEIEMNRKLITNLNTDEDNDLSAVNMITLKKFHPDVPKHTHEVTKDIDLKELFNVIQSKQRNLNELKTHYDSLVSFEEVNENFLSRQEEFPMQTQLNMNHNSITNLKDPEFGGEAATKSYADKKLDLVGGTMTGSIDMGTHEITNLAKPTENNNASTKKYVDDTDKKLRDQISQEVILIQNALDEKVDLGKVIDMKGERIINLGKPLYSSDAINATFLHNFMSGYLNTEGGTMEGQIDMANNKIINLPEPTSAKDAATKDFVEKSHVSQSGLQQNVFLYQMTDVNESSSESNITVTGIKDFPNTPHTLFKKAYHFTIGKNAQNEYNARIGFNFNPVPTGAYTYVVEYFPPFMIDVSVDCRSTPLNVNKQIFKKFPTYVKNIVQIHKWQMATPDYLMIDLKSKGGAATPTRGDGRLIVYGIKGTHNDVSSSVLDTPYVVENGKMVMETDLDLNGKRLLNLNLNYPKSKAVIHGLYSIQPNGGGSFTIDGVEVNHNIVFGFNLTIKKVTLCVRSSRGRIIPQKIRARLNILPGKEQRASGVKIGSDFARAMSFSFDFAVGASEIFKFSLEDGGVIGQATVVILIEI